VRQLPLAIFLAGLIAALPVRAQIRGYGEIVSILEATGAK